MEHIHSNNGSLDWEMITEQLPSCWREMADTHRLFPKKFPPHMGTKITDIATPLRMVLHHAGTGASLKVTTAMAAAAGLVDISHVGLHKWMIKIGPYLADLCAHLAHDNERFNPAKWVGYEVIAIDATVLTCPGAEGTTARVHYAIRLEDLHPVELQITDPKGGETYRRFEEVGHRKQIWVGDRAYSNPPGVAFVKSRGAEVLVRYNRHSLPLYDESGRSFDVSQALARLKNPQAMREWDVVVHPKGEPSIRGRLCAVKLPKNKAEEAQKRVRREHKKKTTAQMLEDARYVVIFTTVPRADLDTQQVLDLYSLRWQVELFIKRDKSIGALDGVPNFKPETVYSWICAKQLLLLIACKTASSKVAIPPSCERFTEISLFSTDIQNA